MTETIDMTTCGNDLERYHDVCKPAFDRIEEQLKQINHSLNGNGKPGIISRLNVIESAAAGSWSIIKPILISMITAALIGGAVLQTRPDNASAEEIAKAVQVIIQDKNK